MSRSKSVLRSAAIAVLLLGEAAALQTAPASGPLQKHPSNPRYFTDGSGRAVYLTGSHVWNNAQDGQWAVHLGHPGAFDNAQYLNFLQNYKHNFIRLWTPENASNVELSSGTLISPVPYGRTGPGTALDGQPKFNLNQLNQAYFDRVRQRVIAARDRGIYVAVMLFDGWGVGIYSGFEKAWRGHPYHASNNVNGINGDPNGDGRGLEVHTLQIPAITSFQKAYVKKVIDTVGDLDNVLYEIANEAGSHSTAWQYDMINYIKNYEAGRPKRHPVGMTFHYPGGSNADLFNSPADWISPNNSGGYDTNPPAASGAKVILSDTDHIWGVGGDRVWVWKSFTRGLNPIFMDPIHFGQPNSVGQSFQANTAGILTARPAQGHTRSYADKMNLAAMTPQNGLASTTYCLASAGSEYLVYQPSGGAFTVNLAAGGYSVEWFNPANGAVSPAGTVAAGGGNQSFTPPFGGDAVLYLKASGAPPPPSAPQLVGHWKFDEGSGGVAGDSSGKGNTGTLLNGASWTSGKSGAAAALDGVDDHVKVNPSTSLNGVTSRITMAAWVYRNANQASDRLVVSRQYGTSFGDQYFLGFHDNIPMAGVNTPGGLAVCMAGAAPNAQWVHLAGTYDGTAVRLYVNGTQVATKPAAGNILVDASRPLILGAGQNDATAAVQEAFNGRIDDARLYSYALSAAEVQSLAGGAPPPPPGNGMGLRAEYFDNADFTALRVARTDPAVNFDWALGAPDPAVGADTFSARWTGQVEAPASGTYTFFTVTDDGVRLWVNGALLINQWILQGATEWSGSIALTGGQKVAIRMEFFENGGYAVAKLLWSGPGIAKQIIPQSRLYSSSPPSAPAELIGHWKLDEGSGSLAADGSGKGNTGTLLNGAAWTSGRLASAVAFDGVNDHIKVNPSTSLNGVTNRLTISTWVYRNANQPGDRLVVSRQQGLSWDDQYFLGFHDNAYLAGVHTPSGYFVIIGGVAPNAQWIHLAATYDGATLRLYVNGSQIATKAAVGNIVPDATRPLIIGAGQNDGTAAVQEAVSGRIDDVRLYTRVLTASEIQSLAAGAP